MYLPSKTFRYNKHPKKFKTLRFRHITSWHSVEAERERSRFLLPLQLAKVPSRSSPLSLLPPPFVHSQRTSKSKTRPSAWGNGFGYWRRGTGGERTLRQFLDAHRKATLACPMCKHTRAPFHVHPPMSPCACLRGPQGVRAGFLTCEIDHHRPSQGARHAFLARIYRKRWVLEPPLCSVFTIFEARSA